MELRLEHLVKDFSGTKAVNDVSITIHAFILSTTL